MKFFGDETTYSHGKEMPKTGSDHTTLAVITIDFVYRKDGNHYQQVFLKEHNTLKKVIKHITDESDKSYEE